jgi:hypothetical protein
MKRLSLLTHVVAALIVIAIAFAMYAALQQVHASHANKRQLPRTRDIDGTISITDILIQKIQL